MLAYELKGMGTLLLVIRSIFLEKFTHLNFLKSVELQKEGFCAYILHLKFQYFGFSAYWWGRKKVDGKILRFPSQVLFAS